MPREFRFTERQLSSAEIVLDLQHGYGANVLLHVGILRSGVQISELVFAKALEKLTEYQPLLRMKIVTEQKESGGTKKRFEEMETFFPDPQITRGTDRKSWVSIAEAEMSEGFVSNKGPLWKIRYVEFTEMEDTISTSSEASRNGQYEGALFFKAHNVIADGISVFDLLHKQFIPILNDILVNGNSRRFPTPLFMLPPPDASFSERDKTKSRKSHKASFKSGVFHDETNPSDENFRPLLSFVPKSDSSSELSETRLLPFALSPGGTRAFLEKCVEHKVSVHAALVTACAIGVGIVTNWEGIEVGEHILCGFTVDLRQFRTLHSPQSLGHWQGYGTTRVKRHKSYSSTMFWKEVKKIEEQQANEVKPWRTLVEYDEVIKKIVKARSLAPVTEMTNVHFQLDHLGSFDDIDPLMVTPRSSIYDDTDSGSVGSAGDASTLRNGHASYPGMPYENDSIHHQGSLLGGGHVRMVEHYFMKSISDVNNVPLVVSVASFTGRLMWTVTYNAKWIARPMATKLIDLLLRIIRDVCDIQIRPQIPVPVAMPTLADRKETKPQQVVTEKRSHKNAPQEVVTEKRRQTKPEKNRKDLYTLPPYLLAKSMTMPLNSGARKPHPTGTT